MNYETRVMGKVGNSTRWYGFVVTTYPADDFHYTSFAECYPIHCHPKTFSLVESRTAEDALIIHDRIVADLRMQI